MKVFFVFFLVLVFGVVSSHGRTYEINAARSPFPIPAARPDEFFLVQQWPATYCRVFETPRYRCHRPIRLYFTVHGLWAQWKGNAYNCNGRMAINFKNLNPKAESNLKTYWPNLNGKDQEFWRRKLFNWPLKLNPETKANLEKYWPNLNGDNLWFWESEYDKHASCISRFQNDEENYYSTTLKLAKNYNVTAKLLNAGIKPCRKPYQISNIKKAIFDAIGVNPKLECNYAKDGTVTTVLLFQIYLCFDNDFNLKNCGQPYKNCPLKNWDGLISFPFPVRPSQSLPVLSSTGKWTMN